VNDDQNEAQRFTEEGPPWKLVATLVLVVLLAIFFFQNNNKARVDFLWMNGDWPIWAVIGVSVLIGVALDRLIGWQWRRSRRRRANGT
jgi:uncharacterized integral membrane protein